MVSLSGSIVGTLRYMSPEQASGQHVLLDGRTDVYSLGVTLYELLTLEPALDGADRSELLRKIAQDEPAPLRKLNPAVPADLETIVHKAMAKECKTATRRPRSWPTTCGGCSKAGRSPPAGRPWPSGWKWCKRHKPVVAAAAVLLVLATAGLAVSAALLKRANTLSEQRRQQAEANLAQAERNYTLAREAVDRYLTRVSEDRLLNQPHMVKLRQELLETAREFYQKLVDERLSDPSAQSDVGAAHLRLFEIEEMQGKLVDAQFEALAAKWIFQRLAAEHPAVADYRHNLARSYLFLASFWTDFTSTFAGQMEEAESWVTKAMDIEQELTLRDPSRVEYQTNVARSRQILGVAYAQSGRMAAAESCFNQALASYQELSAAFPEDFDYKLGLATIHLDLGILYTDASRIQEAESSIKRSIAMLDPVIAAHPYHIKSRLVLFACHDRLGHLHEAARQMTEAETSYKRALMIGLRLATENPELIGVQIRLAHDHDSLGRLYRAKGRMAEAEASYKNALVTWETVVSLPKSFVLSIPSEHDLADTLDVLGNICMNSGRTGEAETRFKSELLIRQKLAHGQAAAPPHESDLKYIYAFEKRLETLDEAC